MNKKASYWQVTDSGVQCDLCPHHCLIKNNRISPCRTRIAKDNILYTLAYGNPIAANADPVEKKPLFHFMPGHLTFSIATEGCNLHCKNCQNASISQSTPSHSNHHVSPKEVVDMAINYACKSISLTYTDPVAYYEYALDVAHIAHSKRIPVILVSAGYINQTPLLEILPYISAANIDLKSMSDSFYRKNCKATLSPVLSAIQTIHQSDTWLELTNLIIPGMNDSAEDLLKLCTWMYVNKMQNVPIHFSRFFPQHKQLNTPPTSMETMLMAKSLASDAGLNYVYLGNIHTETASNTNCPACGNKLIRRKGYTTSLTDDFIGTCPACHCSIQGVW